MLQWISKFAIAVLWPLVAVADGYGNATWVEIVQDRQVVALPSTGYAGGVLLAASPFELIVDVPPCGDGVVLASVLSLEDGIIARTRARDLWQDGGQAAVMEGLFAYGGGFAAYPGRPQTTLWSEVGDPDRSEWSFNYFVGERFWAPGTIRVTEVFSAGEGRDLLRGAEPFTLVLAREACGAPALPDVLKIIDIYFVTS